jgi:molybdopterin-guanine dinucleotide biosynthesis protein A
MPDASQNEALKPLPIHGFVLAGGKSTRMGQDKALLRFSGRPMVEIAVEKLRSLCAEVSIVGNRDDLAEYAEVVREERIDCGPAAGIEAGLRACRQPWAMFIPVDVPLVPPDFLRLWAEEALRVGMSVSYLYALQKQPAFCLLQRERQASFSRLLDEGERRLELLLNNTASADNYSSWMYEAYELIDLPKTDGREEEKLVKSFMNINTPQELAEAEAWAASYKETR